MALAEEAIVRYSRQILLREVGGVGQEKLLSARVRLLGTGASLSTAAMLLEAGGTPVERGPAPGCDETPVQPEGNPKGEVEGAASPRTREEDAIWLGEVPGCFPDAERMVVLGESEGSAVVLVRMPPGCADCFASALARLGPGPADCRSVRLGALAALAVQRMVLGLGKPFFRVALEPSGWTVSVPAICPRCR